MPPSPASPASPPPNPPPTFPLYSYRTYSPNARLRYLRYPDAANQAVTLLGNGPVGFDLEWRPNFVKGCQENPVALIQLATRHVVLLVQVSAMKEFPEKLKEFLENPDIVKAGVAIQNDTLKLYRDCKVSVRRCVDLSLLARTVDNDNWKGKYKNPIGLSKLLQHYENFSLSKGKTSRSNWENLLSHVQQEYAANDAHAGYIIYNRLLEITLSMPVFPDPVYYTFDAVRGRLCEPSGAQWYARNPDYDPGPPPPKPAKTPVIKSDLVVVTGTSSDHSVPSPLHYSESIVTTNPNWTPVVSNQPNQQCPDIVPHSSVGTQPPEMGWSYSHSKSSNDGRYVPLNNRSTSHGSWNMGEINSPQQRRFGSSQQHLGVQNAFSTHTPSQHDNAMVNSSLTTVPSPHSDRPRRRPRRRPHPQHFPASGP